MNLKIGDIILTYPYKKLCLVLSIFPPMEPTVSWLLEYWKTTHNTNIPEVFDLVNVRFSGNDKIFTYPYYKKCFKKPRFQLKARKKFYSKDKTEKNLKISNYIDNILKFGRS